MSALTDRQLHVLIQEMGVSGEAARALIAQSQGRLAQQIQAIIEAEKLLQTSFPSSERALALMGDAAVEPRLVEEHLGVRYSPLDRARLSIVPFSEKTLLTCKDTHILVPGAALSLQDIGHHFADLLSTEWWFSGQPFARRPMDCRWYLLRKEPFPDSRDLSYQDQLKRLPASEEVPHACEMTYLAVLHYATHGEWLFRYVYGRCRDRDSDDTRIIVGQSGGITGDAGFRVDGACWDHTEDSGVGLASSFRPWLHAPDPVAARENATGP